MRHKTSDMRLETSDYRLRSTDLGHQISVSRLMSHVSCLMSLATRYSLLVTILFAVTASALAAPDTMIIAGPAGSLESDDFVFFWTGRTPTPDTYVKGFYYRLDDESWNWTQDRFIAYYDVADGSHRLDVKAIDNRNAEDPSPASRSFTSRRSTRVEPNEAPFTVQRDFQSYLDSGIVSEGLRVEFENNGRSLSQDATVSTVTSGSEWLITDAGRTYKVKKEGNRLNVYEEDRLFRIDSDFQADLDAGDITSDLRDKFADEGISLSQSAAITIVTEGSEWLIDDEYTVRKEGSRLNVYGDELQFGIELTQYMINRLEARIVSDGLRQEFKDSGITLSQSARVTPGSAGTEWLITDGDRIYIVRKDGNNLSIYQSVNDSASEAISLAPATAIECLSQADSDDTGGVDEDWFRVTAGESGQMTILFQRPGSVSSTVIRLYRYPEVGEGREIARFTAQYRAFFATGIVSGDYLVRVTPDSNENPDAHYFLTAIVDSLPSGILWERERNDESGDATERPSVFLSRQTPWLEMVGSKWSSSDGVDYFKVHIDLDQPAKLSFNLTRPQSASATVRFSPVELAGSEVARFDVSPGSGPQWKVDAGVTLGDYLVEVELPAEQDPDFPYFLTLQLSEFQLGEVWELEPNDFPDSANSLPIGFRLRAAKGHAGDTRDWFRLNVPRDGILNLTTSRILKLDAVNIYLLDPVLLEPVGDPLDYETQEGRQRDYLNLNLLAGEYLIEVDLTNIAGGYWITAQFIDSLEHDAPTDVPLTAGDELKVRMVWEPGNATFDIFEVVNGVVASEPLNSEPVVMYDDGLHGDGEQNDGVYVGIYTVEDLSAVVQDSDNYLIDAKAVAHIQDGFGNTADIAVSRDFTIDAAPPDTIPPEISSVSHDAVGPLRTGQKLTVTIKGEARSAATFDIGEMKEGLPAYDDGVHDDGSADDGVYVGVYTVRAEDYVVEAVITGHLTDEAGNMASLDAVSPVDVVGNRPVISAVDHTGRLTLGREDILKVTLIGDPDGIASFDIVGLVTSIPMYDDGQHDDGDRGDGRYVGTYEVVLGDGIISAPVAANLFDREGRRTSKTAHLRVNIDAVAPAPVVGLEASDRPGDQGGYLTLKWEASTELDFAHYNIYLSRDPSLVTHLSSLVVSDITDREQTTVDLAVEADLTDYFVAITAVDVMDNESVLDEDGGSVAGPVQAFDNIRPAPVKTVKAVDRDQDFGGMIILSWTDVSQDKDFARYNIYQETNPILSTVGLVPVDSIADRYVTIVDMPVASDQVDYYFAVTAVDLSGNESELDDLGGSAAGPVRAINNIGPEPETPVRFLSGPVGVIHHDDVAFHWSRFPLTPSPTPPLTPFQGYYFRLDDDNWRWTTSSTAVYHNLKEGNHTFSVRISDSILNRSFSITPVATSEIEPNDSRDTANNIRAGMVIRGLKSEVSSLKSDEDWFRIHVPVTEPGVMDVFLSPGVGSAPTVSIYRASPFQQVGQFDSASGQPGHFALGVAQVSDYFIQVESDAVDSQYKLVVTVDKLASGFAWEIEDNGVGTLANSIRIGGDAPQIVEVRGNSDGDQDKDWFKVHIPDLQDTGLKTQDSRQEERNSDLESSVLGLESSLWMSLAFHRSAVSAVTKVEIYSLSPDVKDRQIGEISSGTLDSEPAYFTGVVSPGGDYFIKVDNGDESGAYHLLLSLEEIPAEEGTAWEVEPNNLAAYANPLSLGVKQRGTNWDGNADDDWYRLNVQNAGILNLYLLRPSGIGKTLVEFYDVSLALVTEFEADISTAQKGSVNLDVQAGTYYVKVHPQNESDGSEYELTATLVESISLVRLSAEGVEIEREGRPLRAGDVVQVSLVWKSDDGKATFDVGDVKKGIALRAETVGNYRGAYTIAEGDNGINAPVTLHLEDAFGNVADIDLRETVSVDTEPPDIEEISHNGITPLTAGKKLVVQLVGSPKGRARFDIAGYKTGLDMYYMISDEDEPPLVLLSWDWRPGPPFGTVAVGEVKNISQSLKDRVKLALTVYDDENEVIGEASTFLRGVLPGVTVPFKIRTAYTGRENIAKLQLAYGPDDEVIGEITDSLTYSPTHPLTYIGVYQVGDDDNVSDAPIICYLKDAAGNQSVAEAEDRVTFDTIPPVITSLTHDAARILVEGDVLTVTLEGESGGQATFDIGDFRKGIEMKDTGQEVQGSSPALSSYVGTYRVRAGDQVSGALVTGHLKDPAGNEATLLGWSTVSINTSAPGISTVTHNATDVPFTEGETLVVTVQADPGAVATFEVVGLVQNRPMHDDGQHDDGDPGDGMYKGSYTIKRGDNVRDGRVRVSLTSPNGKSVVREALDTISVDTETPAAVTGVRATDRPGDEGGYVTLNWNPSLATDFRNYNIYRSEQPIISVSGLEPIDASLLIIDAGCSMLDAGCSTVQIPVLPLTSPLTHLPSYYFAVTAVDTATNESPVTQESTDGPASGIDNLPPLPVRKVSGSDRPFDNGKVITVFWSDPSAAEDFYRYHIYMDDKPVTPESILSLVPVDVSITDRNILLADIVVPQDGVDFFFAVTSVDFSGNESQITDDSVAGPISSQDNLGEAPETLVKIISGPVGEIHYDDVTFRWTRWFDQGVGSLPGYYYKLDDGNWVWTNETEKTYYDLREGEHVFYVRADLGAGSSDPMPASRVFAVKRLLISEMEPNDGAERANWISKGMTIFGTNAEDGDDDWYRFHVESEGLMTLHFNRAGGTGSTNITIFRSFPPTQETQIGSFAAEPTRQRQSFSTGVGLGDYLVLVDSQGENPEARYEISVTTVEMPESVRWDTENNDLPRMTQLLAMDDLSSGIEVSGFGNDQGDVDWYRLQISGIETGDLAFMNLDFVRPQGAGSTEMSIYASFPVTESPRIGLLNLQPTNNQIQNFSAAVRSGDYYLKVDSSQEADISSVYSFRISFAPALEKWELEPNGVSQFANALSVNEVMKGSSWHPDDDIDWYSIRLDSRGILALSYFRPYGTGSAEIKLMGANVGDIATASAGVFTGQEATIGASLNLGNYLVSIDPENEENSGAEYNLVATLVKSVKLEVTHPLTHSPTHSLTPPPLSAGDAVSLRVEWQPGNTLSFDIGNLRTELPMYDDGAHDDENAQDGVYAGAYTVQPGDDISDAEIVLHLGMPPGQASDSDSEFRWTADLNLEDANVTIDTTPPDIFKVDHDLRLRPLSAGEVLNVTMLAEAGARDAFFDIVPSGEVTTSVLRYLEIPLEEDPDGTYSGSYTVEEGDNLESALVICHLVDPAGNEASRSAERPVSFDTTPPEIIKVEHDAREILVEASVLTVMVTSDTFNGKAAFSVDGLVADRVMYDDGTHGDNLAADGIYTGQYKVKKGDNVTDALVSVKVTDEAGNMSEDTAFEAVSVDTTPPEITSFTHDATDILSEDDVLTVTLKGDPGNTAAFDILDFQTGLPMYDDGTRFDETPNDGIYVGTYVVKEGDSAKDASVVGYLADKNGNQAIQYIFERVNIDAVPPEPIVGVQALDRPEDQGFWLILTWEPSAAEDFDHYNVYREAAPITSVQGLTPVLDSGYSILDTGFTESLVSVPTNGVDYYLAVTAVDAGDNESPIEPPASSVAGPVQAIDNLAPEPVTVVSAVDRPDDQGSTIIVSWTKSSAEEDLDHYSVYLSEDAIDSLKGLEPVLKVEASDVIVFRGDAGALSAGWGTYVTVPYDEVDFYFAVTASDKSGNESPLDEQGRSVAGPVKSADDTPPQPVILIDVVDAPHDDGGFLDVSWQPSGDEAVREYNFYLSTQYIDDEKAFQPVEVVDASRVGIQDSAMTYRLYSTADLVSFYVAVTAVDFGGNSSALDALGRSTAGPVQSVSNIVKAGLSATIFAGFDPDTSLFIPAGAISDQATVDILRPDESTQRSAEEANLFLDRSHIDPQIDSYFADTVRDFRTSALSIRQPVTLTLSYPDVTEIQSRASASLAFDMSQNDELSFRIFRLNAAARIPRWEFVSGPQDVNTSRNTISVQVRQLGVFRVARLKMPENLDRVVVYPNPFIPSQSISGHITFKNLTENFTIQIYDIAGRHVRTIEKQAGGGDEAIWDVRNSEDEEVASGTYVFVIQGDGDTYVGKIVVLR
jgi:hypothetical protein